MTARLSGNFFEYCVYKSFGGQPYDVYSRLKFAFQQPKIYDLKCILKDRTVQSVQLMDDNSGKRGTTSDMIVRTYDGSVIGVSCKKNNMSIKHPCPRGIVRYLNSYKANAFIRTYDNLNKKWYNRMKEYELFKQVPDEIKYSMLNDMTSHFSRYINKDYVKFLLSYDPSKEDYIVHANNDDFIEVYKMRHLELDAINIKCYKHWIHIIIDNKVTLKMRLHTASSRVTKVLKLKFDTQVENKRSLFSVCE